MHHSTSLQGLTKVRCVDNSFLYSYIIFKEKREVIFTMNPLFLSKIVVLTVRITKFALNFNIYVITSEQGRILYQKF